MSQSNSFHFFQQFKNGGTSLAVQWLRLCASTAGGVGSIPGWGTKIPHAVCHGQTMKINKVRIVKYFLKEILTEKNP